MTTVHIAPQNKKPEGSTKVVDRAAKPPVPPAKSAAKTPVKVAEKPKSAPAAKPAPTLTTPQTAAGKPAETVKPATPAPVAPAVPRKVGLPSDLDARNPFCVAVGYVGKCAVFHNGHPRIGEVKATKGDRFQIKTVGVDHPFWTDRGLVFPSAEVLAQAVKWARSLVRTPYGINPETDFGVGETLKDHSGRLVSVFRHNDETYEWFQLGRLDITDDVCDAEDIAFRGEKGPAGTTIPHYRPAKRPDGSLDPLKTRVRVIFPDEETADSGVPLADLRDPRCDTDPLAAMYAQVYAFEHAQSCLLPKDADVAALAAQESTPKGAKK